MPSQPRKPTVSWAASKAVQPAGWRRGSALLPCAGGPHLEHCVQMWSPQHRRDMDLLECVQRRATDMIQGMEHVLIRSGWESWDYWREGWMKLWGDLVAAFQYLEKGRLYSRVCCDRSKGNGSILEEERYRLWGNKSSETLAQVAQRGIGCPIPGDTWGQAGLGSEHPDRAVAVLWGVRLDDL